MPKVSDNTIPDREQGGRVNTHPRLGGEIILTPEDLLEGSGDFVHIDEDGNPLEWTLGQTEIPDGRHVYVGTRPDDLVRQTHHTLDILQPSHVVNYEISDIGPNPPDRNAPNLAKVARPLKPRLKIKAASKHGYPASTEQSPHWYAYSWVKNGKFVGRSPAVPFQLATGQSYRVVLPTDPPEGITKVALLMSVPGNSRPTDPGKMYVQRIVDLDHYDLPYYDLRGPFRQPKNGRINSSNETKLDKPGRPELRKDRKDTGARVAHYTAAVIFTDDNGNTVVGKKSRNKVTIHDSERYNIRDKDGKLVFKAGHGTIHIRRPRAPRGATGWYAMLYMSPTGGGADWQAGWRKVVNKKSGKGGEAPYPLKTRSVETHGWGGDEQYYAANDKVVCVDTDLPPENTTGFPQVEEAPPEPEALGGARPAADKYYVAVTDVVNGVESLPSERNSIEIDDDEVFEVVFRNPKNGFANPTFVERDTNDDPLHWTYDQGGYHEMVGENFELGTDGPQVTNFPGLYTDEDEIDTTLNTYLHLQGEVLSPLSGTSQGTILFNAKFEDASGAGIGTAQVHSIPATDHGEFEEEIKIGPGTSVTYPAGTFTMYLAVVSSGATRNYSLSVSHLEMRQAEHRDREPLKRRRKDPVKPHENRSTRVQDPPEPPWTAEAIPVEGKPDRPKSSGTILQSGTFESGVVPTGFTTTTSGNGAFTVDPLAAITGTLGGRFRKTASGALSTAYMAKTYASTHPALAQRHDLGAYSKMKWATLPSQRTKLTQLRNLAQNRALAWIESSSMAEQAQLTIQEDPVAAGTPTLTLDGTRYNLPQAIVAEVQDLSVTSAPTSGGTIKLNLSGKSYSIQTGKDAQGFGWTIQSTPSTNGTLKYTVNGTTYSINVWKSDSKADICERIKAKGATGYKFYSWGGAYMEGYATQPGTRPAPFIDGNGTGTNPITSWTWNGTNDTAADLVDKIKAVAYADYTATETSSTVVRFTGKLPGNKSASTFSANGVSGVAASFTTITNGSTETATSLAALIRAQSFTGWTTGGTGTNVTFTATSGGVRTNPRYRANGTGATGTMKILRQGSNATITAHVKDRFDDEDSRRIMFGVGTGVVFNTDVAISGAGTERAVVSFWGSTGTNPLQLLARFEDVNLGGTDEEDFGTNHLYVDRARFGVAEEESSSDLWDLYVDQISVTNRGVNFYRDHNVIGEWLPQVFYHAPKGTPVQRDLLLQDGRAAIIPGDTYTLGAFVRARMNQTQPLRPLVATCHRRDKHGKTLRYEMGDVTNTTGLTGINPWAEYSLTFEVPEDCYHVTLESKDVGGAEVVMQEVTFSPGSSPKRSYLYATSGQYTATQRVATPDADQNLKFWTHDIIHIDANVHNELDEVTGTPLTTSLVEMRSADPLANDSTQPDPATWTSFQTDWKLVAEKDFVQTRVTLTGPGHLTPVIPTGDPHVEYILRFGKKRLSTFLDTDRTELPGGAAFENLEEFTYREPQSRKRLPSGQLYDEPTIFEAVGHLPEYTVIVYTSEAREYIEENWREEFVVEQFGRHALTVKLPEQPEFKRDMLQVNQEQGQRYSIWKAKIPPNQVTQVRRLKERSEYP